MERGEPGAQGPRGILGQPGPAGVPGVRGSQGPPGRMDESPAHVQSERLFVIRSLEV